MTWAGVPVIGIVLETGRLELSLGLIIGPGRLDLSLRLVLGFRREDSSFGAGCWGVLLGRVVGTGRRRTLTIRSNDPSKRIAGGIVVDICVNKVKQSFIEQFIFALVRMLCLNGTFVETMRCLNGTSVETQNSLREAIRIRDAGHNRNESLDKPSGKWRGQVVGKMKR